MKTAILRFIKSKITLSAAVIIVLGSIGAYAISGNPIRPIDKAAIRAYAEKVVALCSGKNYRPGCYDKEIPKLMDEITMEDAFRVTRIVQNLDAGYQYCHVLGHELSAREVAKDPSKWKEVVSRCPSGMCSNGCIHGGFQERFRAESLEDDQIAEIKPDLMSICEKRENWNPTGLEQGSCYHAVGHLTMYLTAADIGKSIRLCEEIAVKSDGRDYRPVCFDGVFMQIFQPLEPEDFALVAGKQPAQNEVLKFCGVFAEGARASCLSESWPLFNDEIKTPQGLAKFCSMSAAGYVDRCYNGLFYVITSQFNFDSEKITAFCAGLSKERIGQCFANAAGRMIETDYQNINKSVALCSSAIRFAGGERCFEEMVFYSTFNFLPGSPEFFSLCNALPSSWQEKCLNKNQHDGTKS